MLPPERQLAEMLGVNRLTLRAALARLETEGLVIPRQGHGIRVQDWRQSGGLALLKWMGDDDSMRELLALRRALAAEAIYGACIHADPEQLRVLQQISGQQQNTENADAFFEGDLRFTRALVSASGNTSLILIFNTIEQVCRVRPGVLKHMLSDREAARGSYRALLALVRSGEAELARRAILQTLSDEDQPMLAEILSR